MPHTKLFRNGNRFGGVLLRVRFLDEAMRSTAISASSAEAAQAMVRTRTVISPSEPLRARYDALYREYLVAQKRLFPARTDASKSR